MASSDFPHPPRERRALFVQVYTNGYTIRPETLDWCLIIDIIVVVARQNKTVKTPGKSKIAIFPK